MILSFICLLSFTSIVIPLASVTSYRTGSSDASRLRLSFSGFPPFNLPAVAAGMTVFVIVLLLSCVLLVRPWQYLQRLHRMRRGRSRLRWCRR